MQPRTLADDAPQAPGPITPPADPGPGKPPPPKASAKKTNGNGAAKPPAAKATPPPAAKAKAPAAPKTPDTKPAEDKTKPIDRCAQDAAKALVLKDIEEHLDDWYPHLERLVIMADGEANVTLTITVRVKKQKEPGLGFELESKVSGGCPKTERTASLDKDKKTGATQLVLMND